MLLKPFEQLGIIVAVHAPVYAPPARLPVVGAGGGIAHLDVETSWAPDGKLVPLKISTRDPEAWKLTAVIQAGRHISCDLVLFLQPRPELRIQIEVRVGV